MVAAGSSPLARGTRLGAGAELRRGRFIPARAGNTPCRCRRASGRPVHPRSRGEHAISFVTMNSRGGSSPLARGTPDRCRCTFSPRRFIPARAGNTTGSITLLEPRCGSSPLARGTLRRFFHAAVYHPVHPRSRGEHAQACHVNFDKGGSSPLARGTPAVPRRPIAEERFIPARAGNTPPDSISADRSSVHPRSRGEHAVIGSNSSIMGGSSPLARGTPLAVAITAAHQRFIPARAGNT